ncbi:hypothetical protein NUK34_08160 [Kerstersia gyiorum]|uniref:GrlR family regulatory protein n=1 Tax=Kerstersia gyiorum TaxID=206506 RepID=UPI0021505A10|nr:GrlR family regulatory protein [Kerstersia gyiorum]MCR4158825.1 hypothetical protein [Kerstersia gyiorum]
MIEGFWTVIFRSQTDVGAGVVTVTNGKILGGDTSFTYTGPFEIDANGRIKGELAVRRHSKFLPSVLPGLDNYTLQISGSANNESLRLSGQIAGKNLPPLEIIGTKISTL